MSNWISSKLKVAESFLQQIDQQAAESLGKGERSRPEVVDGHGAPARPESVPLKEQLKTRSPAPEKNGANWDSSSRVQRVSAPAAAAPSRAVVRPDLAAAASDTDWTELLSSSNSIPPAGRIVGDSTAFRSQKDRNKNGIGVLGPGKNRRNAGSVVPKSTLKPSTITERKTIWLEKSGIDKNVNDEEVGFSGRTERSATVQREPVEGNNGYSNGDDMPQEVNEVVLTKEVANEQETPMGETVISFDWRSVVSGGDGISTSKGQADGDAVREDEQRNYERGNSSDSDRGSDSESDSSAPSDSEDEVERRKAEQILAEERAARALEALQERENVVARLEGEKLSLERIVEEREKQQAEEASELQLSTIETMDAVELEKQKLDSTRMEALSRLTKLETSNAELAKSLAATQWNLEIEVNLVAELRQQLEYKEMILPEIRSSISKSSLNLTSLEQPEESKQDKLERALLETDYSFTCDKIAQLQEKAKALTKDIETTQREIEDPTQVEIELKKRLAQLTDHLIQKQAQVEALASEKATLAFRIETVTRLIDEEKAAEQLTNADDVEAGAWKPLNSKLKPMFRRKIRTGGQQLWSILKQLDSIFSAGSMYIRRNPKAQIWSLVYLVCLHLWVLYIFTSHSQVEDNNRSGAIISLDSINKTTGR